MKIFELLLDYLRSLLEFLMCVCTLGSTCKATCQAYLSRLWVKPAGQACRSSLAVKPIGQCYRSRCTCALITMCCTCAGSLVKRLAETFLFKTETETAFPFTFRLQYCIVD